MTDPSDTQRERETDATADPKPELNPEVIKDLSLLDGDADVVRGGVCEGARTAVVG